MFEVNEETREIYIYDDIGPSWMGMIDAGAVVEGLAILGGSAPVHVRINSPGGDVMEALAIYNAIQRHPGPVNTYNDGMAASAGSYIFAAGIERIAAPNSITMIHDPWGMSIGNAADHRSTADIYDRHADGMSIAYAQAMNTSTSVAREIMVEETWMDASEALERGMATIVGDVEVAEPAMVASGRYRNTPQASRKAAQPGERTTYAKRDGKLLRARLERARL